MSDHTGARTLLDTSPKADILLADKGYDSNWFRVALQERKIAPCIPPLRHRTDKIFYDKELYKQRHKIENMFGRLKDWRRIHTRYDRCAHTFMSAITIAAIICHWINQ